MGKRLPKIEAVAHHRNGIHGAPFSLAIVKDPFRSGDRRRFLVVHFDKERTAVLCLDRLPNIRFGEEPQGNSWRSDRLDPTVQEALQQQLE